MLNTWGLTASSIGVHEGQYIKLLPFLYQTRTLLADGCHSARLGQSSKHSRRSHFGTLARQQAHNDRASSPRANKLDTNIRENDIRRGRHDHLGFRRVKLPTTEPHQPPDTETPTWDDPFPLYRTVAKQRQYQKSAPPSTLRWNDVNIRRPELACTPKQGDHDRRESDYESPTDSRQAPVSGWGPRTSTMTASEKAVFEKIYNDITKSSATTADQPEDTRLEEDEDELLARDQLSSLFEDAIGLLERKPQIANISARYPINESAKSHDAQHNASNVSRHANSHTRLDTEEMNSSSSQSPEDAQKPDIVEERAVRDYSKLVDGKFEQAHTDVEVWNVLQNEVFSLIGQLEKQNKLEEKAQKAQKSKARKLKSKAKARAKATADLNGTLDSKPLADDQEQFPSATDDSQNSAQDSNENFVSKSPEKKILLHMLRETYASNCVKALRIFRRRFPSTPYSLHLLSHLKSLGSLSYVLGATSSVYDEILFQKWNQYADVQGLADTMEEMYNHGVPPTPVTLRLLRLVSRIRTSELNGEEGEVAKTWWRLRSVAEGWDRVKKFYDYFKRHMPADEVPQAPSASDEQVKSGVYAAKHYSALRDDIDGGYEDSGVWPNYDTHQQQRNERALTGLRDRETSPNILRSKRSTEIETDG